jgi:hypothetical protein
LHVPTHAGYPPNELVDSLSKHARQNTLCRPLLAALASAAPPFMKDLRVPHAISIADSLWWTHHSHQGEGCHCEPVRTLLSQYKQFMIVTANVSTLGPASKEDSTKIIAHRGRRLDLALQFKKAGCRYNRHSRDPMHWLLSPMGGYLFCGFLSIAPIWKSRSRAVDSQALVPFDFTHFLCCLRILAD